MHCELGARHPGRERLVGLVLAPGLDQVVGCDPERRAPALRDVWGRREVRALATHHLAEVLRVGDDVVGDRRDVPLRARCRPGQDVVVNVVEQVTGLGEGAGKHAGRGHAHHVR